MDSNDLLNVIKRSRTNPSACIQDIVELVEETVGGSVRFVDPTNPVVLAFETSINAAASAVMHSEGILRKMNASLATNEDDLYRHMSDKDYIGRFGTPSVSSYKLGLPIRELNDNALPVGNTGTRMVVIPKNTEFIVRDVTFSMQYPIQIRVLPHGGVRAVYDVSKISPLQTLSSNIVPSMISRYGTEDYLFLDIALTQFKIKQEFMTITQSGGHTEKIIFDDSFYYCRMYIQVVENGEWVEIKTTHSDQVFDVNVPTGLIKLHDGYLVAYIPPIYINTGMIRNNVRIDIYTTKGPLDMDLSAVDGENDLRIQWTDLDKDPETAKYLMPITTMAIRAFSDQTTSGGALSISFADLRSRVINNAFGSPNLPITKDQLITDLENRGYSVVAATDVVTERTFQATRKLPLTSASGTSSSAGSVMSAFYTTIETLAEHNATVVNGERLTILPKMLFKRMEGKLFTVSDSELTALMSQPLDTRIATINATEFLYTPFHYVFDTTNGAFEVRSYYLDAPTIDSRQFINENSTAGLVVSTRDYLITRIDNGYRLVISTRSGDTFKELDDSQISVQLSYIPKGERYRATLVGQLVGVDPETSERIYQFDIITKYDINKEDEIYFTSFKMFDELTLRTLASDLVAEFDLIYVVTDYVAQGMKNSAIDQSVAVYLLEFETNVKQFVGVAQERFGIRFGHALHGMWNKSRTIIGPGDYQRWSVDVPDLWEKTVYQTDVNGYIVFTDDGNGNFLPTVVHEKDAPKLDEDDEPIYLHRAGDIMYLDGEPVPVSPRKLLRESHLFLMDGLYYFATTSDDASYKQLVPRSVVSWLREDIDYYQTKALEITKIFFYPKTTIGPIEVTLNGEERSLIQSDQRLTVNVYLREVDYRNAALRMSLTNEIKQIINSNLQATIVASMDILADIRERLADKILGCDIVGFGGRNDVSTVGILDASHELVIGKKLEKTDDGFLSVVDDLTVSFSILAN